MPLAKVPFKPLQRRHPPSRNICQAALHALISLQLANIIEKLLIRGGILHNYLRFAVHLSTTGLPLSRICSRNSRLFRLNSLSERISLAISIPRC